MKMFGYKIVEKSRDTIEPVVNAAITEQRPLEVGLYFNDPQAWELLHSRLPGAGIPINTHINHNRVGVFSLSERETELRQQIAQAQSIGSSYSITHLHKMPVPRRAVFRDSLAAYLTQQLQVLERICSELDHPLYVENTFHGLEVHRWFFDLVERLELRYVHHCFDLGHAKLWSEETLPEWLQWLEALTEKGFKLHFHLHANNGLWDQHLAFTEVLVQGLDAADAYTPQWDYFAVLAQLRDRFPLSRKVFEVKPQQALANMALVQERLRAIG
jgi:hypothetical protein